MPAIAAKPSRRSLVSSPLVLMLSVLLFGVATGWLGASVWRTQDKYRASLEARVVELTEDNKKLKNVNNLQKISLEEARLNLAKQCNAIYRYQRIAACPRPTGGNTNDDEN